VTTGKGARVFYYNTMGKKFSNAEEINQYFSRLGQLVKPGLFNFEPRSQEEVKTTTTTTTTAGNNNSGSFQQQTMQTVLT
jgi:hypothetical protein